MKKSGKKAEELLKKAGSDLLHSDDKYRTLFELAPVGISVVDSERNIVEYNHIFGKVARLSSEEIKNGQYKKRQYLRSDGTEMYPEEYPDYIALKEKRAVYDIEIGIIDKDGNTFWTEVSAAPLKDYGNFAVVITEDITDHKNLEIKLKTSEDKFRSLYENSIDAILLTEPEGAICSANEAACKMLERTEEEICRLGRKGIVDQDDPKLPDALKEREKTGKFFGQLTMIKGNGTKFPVEISSNIFTDAIGRKMTSMVIRDITGRKKAEESLKASQSKYQTVFESTGTATLLVEEDTTISMANIECYSVTGYSPAELVGQKWTQFVSAESLEEMIKNHNLRRKDPSLAPKKYEVKLVNKKGECRNALLDIGMIPGTRQSIVSILDLTKQKQTENKLQETIQLLQGTFSVLNEAVLVVDSATMKIRECNKTTETIFGYNHEELIGKTTEFLHINERNFQNFVKMAIEQIKQKNHFECEYRMKRRDGTIFPTENFGHPLVVGGKTHSVVSVVRDISLRKRMEEIIKKEQQELKLILDSSPIIIFYKDNEGKFIHVNKTFSEAINLPEEEFVGKTVFDLHSGEIAQSMTNDDQEVFKSGRPKLNIIEQYKSVSGLRWVRTDKIPIFDKDNIPVGLIGFAQDITEQHLAEDALRQSEMKMRTLFDILPTGVSILDAERNIVFINPALERILNMTRDGFIKGDYKSRKYLRPDGTQMPEEEYASVRAIREKREVYDVETGVVMEDGHVIWTNVTAAPVEFTDWKVVIITTDITQRKQAEVALYKSEKSFRQLYQQAPLSYQSLNAEGYLVDVNQAWLNLFQYSRDEVIGRWFGDFLAPHEVEAFKQRFPRFITTGEVHVDLEMIQSAGSVIIVHIDGKIGHDENGQFKQTHCILYNITEHKKAENALRLEKENFRHSLDDSPLGIRITTKEGNTIYTNKALLDMYGYNTLEELQKTRLKNRYTPESYKQAQQRKHRRKDDDLTDNNYEISIVRKNGEIRHLQVWRKEILWDGVRQFQVIYDDITDRKRAEEKIKEFRNYMDFFFRQSLEGIYFTAFDDPLLWNDSVDKEKALDYAHKHQIIINVNDAFLAQYGVSKEDVIGKPVSVLFEHDREQGRRGRRELFDKRQIHLVTNEKQKDGSEVWIEGEYICMYDDKGRITGTFGAQRNITDRIKAEEELKNSTKLLESLHEHLNEIRENERTLISREIHDQVGQSLTALKLDLNWMHKYIKTNREAAIKLGGMIELITNTIKDVQRISSDLRPGILDDLGLVAAIEWYCDEFEKRTGIKCRLIPDDSIYNDSQKNLVLFRVLQEAFTNIIRHANASSVTVKLHQTRKGITLTVQDNGIGIAGEKIESPKSLGLIGMRERIKQFGGMVNVSSGKVHGTKLTIFIPEKKNSI